MAEFGHVSRLRRGRPRWFLWSGLGPRSREKQIVRRRMWNDECAGNTCFPISYPKKSEPCLPERRAPTHHRRGRSARWKQRTRTTTGMVRGSFHFRVCHGWKLVVGLSKAPKGKATDQCDQPSGEGHQTQGHERKVEVASKIIQLSEGRRGDPARHGRQRAPNFVR